VKLNVCCDIPGRASAAPHGATSRSSHVADDARQPRYIETIHRRGFRFLAASLGERAAPFERTPCATSTRALGPIVGRDSALEALTRGLAHARDGPRQTMFVTGEPGIGKTALVEVALAHIDERVARAECVEHYGAGEAYQPLLDALTRLGTQAQGADRRMLLFVPTAAARTDARFRRQPVRV
jgi:hypothetical protein